MRFTPQRRIDREAVRKSLRELELLFGRKPPDTKGNTALERGVGSAVKPLLKESKNEC